jgi:drug/metabolite transporter (DMT)-like permease
VEDPDEAMTDDPHPLRRRAVFMLVLATLYWGLSFPVIKSITLMNRALLPAAGPMFIASLALAPRFVLATVLVLVFRRRGEAWPNRLEIRQGLGMGAFAAAGIFLQTDGLQYTDASTSSFLTQFSAILIPVWLALRNRRNPGWIVWAGCTLVLVGVAILGHFDWRTLRLGRGEEETIACSLFFMGQILWLEKPEFAGNRVGPITLAMFSIQALAFLGFVTVEAPTLGALTIPWESPVWVGLTLTLTVVCTVGPFTIMNRWQPKITSTQAGLIYCIEPLFASLFALFVPGILSIWAAIHYPDERATWSLVLGGGLITFANVLVQTRPAVGKSTITHKSNV